VNNSSQSCTVDSDCNFGTCTTPPNFNYRAEMHPPQAIAVVRNKSILKTPATQADVYVSSDAGGAGDLCTDTHLAIPSQVLFNKACFQNHCSVTVGRSCKIDKDCATGEQCIVFASTTDPTKRIANVNAQDFEFDMPLPPQPVGSTALQIKTKSFKPLGGVMPKPIFQPTFGPTPNLHVVIPMAVVTPLPTGQKAPNVFAERISVAWKKDPTKLTHVQVKFTKLTINNPLKDRVSAMPRQCLLPPPNGGFSDIACNTDTDCPIGACDTSHAPCYTDSQCPKLQFCQNAAHCVGGVTPGWDAFGQVNGDWVQFSKLTTIGTTAPFVAPPYTKPSPTPLIVPQKFTFDEYVPSAGSIHIATSGHSRNCIDTLYAGNLKDALNNFGLSLGAGCLGSGSTDPGRVDISHAGPNFTDAPAGAACTPPAKPTGATTCRATSGDGNGGTCSVTTNKLCTSDADCPGTCSTGPAGSCLTASDCQHCSVNTNTFCASDFDCPKTGVCANNANKFCHSDGDCSTLSTTVHCTGAPETCVATAAACNNVETCNGTCAGDGTTSCHVDSDCTGPGGPCVNGGAFTLEYTIQVKK
jgi:hypothetical protein